MLAAHYISRCCPLWPYAAVANRRQPRSILIILRASLLKGWVPLGETGVESWKTIFTSVHLDATDSRFRKGGKRSRPPFLNERGFISTPAQCRLLPAQFRRNLTRKTHSRSPVSQEGGWQERRQKWSTPACPKSKWQGTGCWRRNQRIWTHHS
jgi:hypothetical protein